MSGGGNFLSIVVNYTFQNMPNKFSTCHVVAIVDCTFVGSASGSFKDLFTFA